MSDPFFTKSLYKLESPQKDGKGNIKFIKDQGRERYTVVTQTAVTITRQVRVPDREAVLYSTKTVQIFHSKASALAEYNRQQARLEHHGWERLNANKARR